MDAGSDQMPSALRYAMPRATMPSGMPKKATGMRVSRVSRAGICCSQEAKEFSLHSRRGSKRANHLRPDRQRDSAGNPRMKPAISAALVSSAKWPASSM